MFNEFAEGDSGTITLPAIDLSKPSVKGLAVILRDKSLWPRGFKFDYTHCQTCAMGLAEKVWGSFCPYWSYPDNTAKILGISMSDANRIFMARSGTATPEAIAEDLEAL
jgi:hypothetical protein